MLVPTFFLDPAVPPHFFHSRIATGVTQIKTSGKRQEYFVMKKV